VSHSSEKMSLYCRHIRVRELPVCQWWDMYWCSEQIHMRLLWRIHRCKLWNWYVWI